MKIGTTIAEIRQLHKMTQEDFAKIFHVTRQTVSNWENEKSYPDIQTLIDISDRFGISLDKMLKEDISMVKAVDKERKAGKGIKRTILLAVILFLAVSAVYAGVWNKTRNELENKFQQGIKEQGFIFDDELGYYTREDEDGTLYTLPNQKMPGILDFRLDFHAKHIRGYVSIEEGVVEITASGPDDMGAEFITYSSSYASPFMEDGQRIITDLSSFKDAEHNVDNLGEADKEKMKAAEKEMSIIYKSVYK